MMDPEDLYGVDPCADPDPDLYPSPEEEYERAMDELEE